MDFNAYGIWAPYFIYQRKPVVGHKLVFQTVPLILVVLSVFLSADAAAQFSSRFSLTVGEEYNDNIFFEKRKTHDFITSITPTLTFIYELPLAVSPTFTLNISPSGQIFARNSDLNNFGENVSADLGYTYNYSPRLTFHISDVLQRTGATRSITGATLARQRRVPTVPPTPGVTEPLPVSQRLGDFISNGDTLANYFSLESSYLYAPDITFTGGYANAYTNFLDRGGSDLSHSVSIRGTYKWRQEHNLYAGYTLGIVRLRNGDNNVIHNFDIGDDYFSSYRIRLTPTLTLSASTGLGISTGSEGTHVVNNLNLTLDKIWETASFTVGVRKGLTSSFGVSGLSDTTSFFTDYDIRLTERLTGIAGVEFSLFDTEDVNFKTFNAHAGFRYWFTSWFSSDLTYSHRRLYSGSGGRSTELLTSGNVNSNSVVLSVSAHFDIWPNFALAKMLDRRSFSPSVPRQPIVP